VRATVALRAFFEQLAGDAGFILDWQRREADRNIAASADIMRGDPTLMRKMLDELVRALTRLRGGSLCPKTAMGSRA
jgi:fido (protein-threonine AMPylation protein)